jgi:glycogen operon protein
VSAGPENGSSSPLGATPSPGGVNFSVFSRHATGVELLLFDGVDDLKAARVVRLDPAANRTPFQLGLPRGHRHAR